MSAGDCARVAQLHRELDVSFWSPEQWREALATYPCSWVLADNNQVQSYVCFQTAVPQVELLNLGVAKSLQGRGLGREFLRAALCLLPPQSESVFLEVRRSNHPAIRLYESLGFVRTGLRRNYYSAGQGHREDALIYQLQLDGPEPGRVF